jgi:hypothetical protein
MSFATRLLFILCFIPACAGKTPLPKVDSSGNALISDPLVDGKATARVVGGKFEPEGWRALDVSDQLHYTLPEGTRRGSVAFEVKGFDITLDGDPRKHFWGLYDVFQTQYVVKDEDPKFKENANGMTLRLYTGVVKAHTAGETRLRLAGPVFEKKQFDNTALKWDPQRWYRFQIEWTETDAVITRDGELVGKLSFLRKDVTFRHLFLNNDNHFTFKGFKGTVYRNVVIRTQAVAFREGLEWDTAKRVTKPNTAGADSWTPTWAADDALYSGYGDAALRPPVPEGVKLGMGFARIAGVPAGGDATQVTVTGLETGEADNWDDAVAGSGLEAKGEGKRSVKPAGMLYKDGTLWVWARNAVGTDGRGARLRYSKNTGCVGCTGRPTFEWVPWSLANVGYPSFIQYGKDYAHGPDDAVYAVIPMKSGKAGDVSDSAYDMVPAFGLLRGHGDLKQQKNWSVYCGADPTQPAWCPIAGTENPAGAVEAGATAARAIYRGGSKFRPRAGVTWNQGLGKYMMALVRQIDETNTRFKGGLNVLTAPQPWGPWTELWISAGNWPGGKAPDCGKDWGPGERADFPAKYMSPDGRTVHLFTSGGDCLSIFKASVQ